MFPPCSPFPQLYLQANLSAQQLAHLHQAWLQYQRSSEAAQRQQAAAASDVQFAAAVQSMSWQDESTLGAGSSAERAQVGLG